MLLDSPISTVAKIFTLQLLGSLSRHIVLQNFLKNPKTHTYKEQIDGHQMKRRLGVGEKGEGIKKYKLPVIKNTGM